MTKLKVFFLGIALVFVLSRIYAINPQMELLGDYGDKYEFISYMYLVKENISAGKFPLAATDTLRYPNGFELGHGFDGVLSTFSGAILSFILPLPLVYNLVLLQILLLNFYLSFLFFAAVSSSSLFGIFGGLLYGLSPYVFARINGHANLAFIGGFPFLAKALYDLFCRKRSGFPAYFKIGLGILLIAFGSLQYLIITFWFLLFLGTAYLLLYPNDTLNNFLEYLKELNVRIRQQRRNVLLAMFIFLALTLFFFSGFIKGFISGSFVYPFMYYKYVQCCLPQFSDIIFPNQYLNQIFGRINLSISSIEKVVSPGIIGWIVFMLYFYLEKVNRRKVLLLLAFGIYLIAALGMIPLPYWPEGGRSVVLFTLLMLIVMSQISFFSRKVFIIPVIILLLLERLTFSVYRTIPLPFMESAIISKLPGKAILNIPLSGTIAYRNIFPILTEKKVVDGYFHDTAENNSTLSFFGQSMIERYFCNFEKVNTDSINFQEKDRENTIALLRNWDIRTIVIHKNRQYEKFFYDECSNVRYWWYNLNPESIVIKNDTEGSVNTTLSLYKYPHLKSGLFFQRGGLFTLEGIYISPDIYSDAKIMAKDLLISPTWEADDTGVKSVMEGPISIKVEPGDELTVFSEKKYEGTIYINFYYSFEADKNSREVKPPIQRVYLSSDYEIFRIN